MDELIVNILKWFHDKVYTKGSNVILDTTFDLNPACSLSFEASTIHYSITIYFIFLNT